MYRKYPEDLAPSRLAAWMAHGGTMLEFAVPVAFLVTPLGTPPLVAVILMLALHAFITSNVPMGVPLEWNVAVVYGGFALFWAHPDVSILAVGPPVLAAFLVVMLVGLPLFGNFFPGRLSFLLAMRYYAGNWAYSVWLFRGDSHEKLARLKKSSGWIYEQLDRFYDRSTAIGLVSKVMAFRLMHLHGRALRVLVPKAIDRLEGHEWLDGEIADFIGSRLFYRNCSSRCRCSAASTRESSAASSSNRNRSGGRASTTVSSMPSRVALRGASSPS